MDGKNKFSPIAITQHTKKTHMFNESIGNLGTDVGDQVTIIPVRILSSLRAKTVQTRARGARPVQHIEEASERGNPDNN